MALTFTPLFINGKQVPSSANATFEVYNPYTRTVVGISASASSDDCLAAVQSAAAAFPSWESLHFQQRKEIVLRAADLFDKESIKARVLEAGRAETAAQDALTVGLSGGAANFLRANAKYAEVVDQVETEPSDKVKGAQVVTKRRAIGVILAISPWNAPVHLSLRAIVMPLLCGNTVILKSSEYTPRSQAIVAEVFQEAGIPPGVLNYISTSRETAPSLIAQIIAHPAVRKINFTGSKRVGTLIAQEAAKHLKPCVLELGGKSPALVLDDADVKKAAQAIVFGAFLHSGQVCMSTCRVIVQRGVAGELIKEICELAKTWKVGAPGVDGAKSGALFTEDLAKAVLGLIEEAKASGAKILVGDGKRDPENPAILQPHVLLMDGPFTGNSEPRLWKDESFGPELIIRTFDDLEEGIALTNDSDYTLTSSLWTADRKLADSVAQRIRAGYVNVNGPTIHTEMKLGVLGLGGSSGYGRFTVDDFTHKRLTIHHPQL